MSKGSVASSVLVVALTGGYFAYEHFSKKKPASSPAPRKGSSTASSSTAGATGATGATGTTGASGTASGTAGATADPTPAAPTVREIKMPSLVGLTPVEATAKLTALGFRDDVLEIKKDISCTYDNDTDMVPQGTICNQARSPGVAQMSNAKVRVALEHDTYESGGVESGSPWRRMPALQGMSLPAAQALLRDKGFEDGEFEVEQRSSCGKGKVCETTPRAGVRKYASTPGVLNVGT